MTTQSTFDIIVIDAINFRGIEYIEIVKNSIFCVKDGKLFKLVRNNNAQYSAEEILPEYKNLSFLMAYQECIYFVMDEDGVNKIFKLDECRAKEVAEFSGGHIGGYAAVGEGYLCFFTQNTKEYASQFYALHNGKLNIAQFAFGYQSIKCIYAYEDQIYIAFGKSNFVASISLPDFYDYADSTNNIVSVNKVIDINCISIFSIADKLLFALDGPTRIVDIEGNVVFNDEKNMNCGYQIAAQGKLTLHKDYTVLGTWRRDEKHPYACYYVLNDLTEMTKECVKLEKDIPWTGYTTYNKMLQSKEFVFSCKNGYPLHIQGFESYAELQNSVNIDGYKLAKLSNDVHIYVKEIVAEPGPRVSAHSQIQRKTYDYCTPVQPSNFYITVDVEQRHKGDPVRLLGKIGDKEYGIYFIFNTLEKYGLKGVFFVNIYEYQYYNGLIERIVKDIHARGHEIGLHCHKSNLDFYKDDIVKYDYDGQYKIIEFGINFIEALINEKPVSFRAGGYNLNSTTLKVLSDLGIKIDSSVFLGVKQNLRYISKNALCKYDNVVEIPVTTVMRDIQPSKIDINWNNNADDLINYVKSCRNYGLQNIVSMLHSYSFIKITRYSNNKKQDSLPDLRVESEHAYLIREFDKFCSFISAYNGIKVKTFKMALGDGDYSQDKQWGKDNIPLINIPNAQQQFCPVCNNAVQFVEYRGVKNSMCPVCHSLNRMRLKVLYLKKRLNIENCAPLKILHIGPARCVRKWLTRLVKHDYITMDPFSEAHFKYSIEDIHFQNNAFDLIICVAVLYHVLDDHKAVEEMHRVLKPGGILLLELGALAEDKTEEFYKREEYTNMEAHDFSYPADLHKPVIKREKGKIFYNPRYPTRKYGRDMLDLLNKAGFTVVVIKMNQYSTLFKFGLNSDVKIIECKKKNMLF